MTDYFGAMGTALFDALTGGGTPTALITTLGGSAIYHMQAPDSASLPYVVFSHQGGGPENNPAGMDNSVWYIRGYASSLAQAAIIDKQIDSLITGKALTISGFTNFWTVRETHVPLIENPPDGGQIYSLGALYRIRLGY
jgi:hypothetical protein